MTNKANFYLLLLTIFLCQGCFIKKMERNFFRETPTHFKQNVDGQKIQFIYAKGKNGDQIEPHEAILIPVQVPGMKHKFYWQFDTGAPQSVFYQRALESMENLGFPLERLVKDSMALVSQFNMMHHEIPMTFEGIKLYYNYGQHFTVSDTTQRLKLGTIGGDYYHDKVLIINFKEQYIQTYRNPPNWITELNGFESFIYEGRRMLLPAHVHDQDLHLFYDSGSSAFGLITTKNRYKRHTDRSDPEVTFDANSWGKKIPIHNKSTDQKIIIGGQTLDLRRMSYVGMYGALQRFVTPFTRIGGWLGNKPFLDHVMIIDTRNKRFIVVDEVNE